MENKERETTKVLVVEDSLTQCMLLQEDLTAQGFKVKTATDGLKALGAIKEEIPDIIVSDIEMPEMDGYELCKTVKQEAQLSQIPIILLTSLSDPREVIKAIVCRADAFLTKPYNINLLSSLIDDMILNRRGKSENTERKNEIFFQGKCYVLPTQESTTQITELLLSTYVSAVQKNKELEEAHRNLTLINQQIKEKNSELAQLNNLKNQFLSMAAHDLRNPLGAIQGYAELIIQKLNDQFPPDYRNILNRIRDTSTFMLNMVNDLLDISVIESGQLKLDLKEINLHSFVQENVQINEKLAERKNIRINFTSSNDKTRIVGDPTRLEQVLNNLINNAIKFSHPESTIDVTIDDKPTEVVLSIADHGVGIEEKDKEHLFTTFSKLSKKGTAGEKSTGLGLAIAKKIVMEHKGRVWAESEYGKGSTFFIALPSKT